MNNEVNLNLNLGLDPTPAPNETDQCKGIGVPERDHIADDTNAQTVTAAVSTEVDSDIEYLDINLLTKDNL